MIQYMVQGVRLVSSGKPGSDISGISAPKPVCVGPRLVMMIYNNMYIILIIIIIIIIIRVKLIILII